MDAYAGPIRRLCGAYAGSAADREDLFQDIFLAVWCALPAFRGRLQRSHLALSHCAQRCIDPGDGHE